LALKVQLVVLVELCADELVVGGGGVKNTLMQLNKMH